MKLVLLFMIAFSINSIVLAKKMDSFNKAMQDEINGFVKNNPEKYETKPMNKPSRKPASVEAIGVQGEQDKKQHEDTYEKIDQFDNQGIGLPKW